MDYAQNSTLRTEAELELYLESEIGTNLLFSVYNTTGHTINAALTLALYKDGELVGIAAKNELIQEGESFQSFNVSSNTGYDSMKLFVWDSLGGMQPLHSVFEF